MNRIIPYKDVTAHIKASMHDSLIEAAIEAAARLAIHLGDDPQATEAWKAAHLLKALRRADVTDRLEAERLAKVTA